MSITRQSGERAITTRSTPELLEGFTYTDQRDLGVRSTRVIVKTPKGHTVGHLEGGDVARFKAGEVNLLEPVATWRNTFSLRLKHTLNLA